MGILACKCANDDEENNQFLLDQTRINSTIELLKQKFITDTDDINFEIITEENFENLLKSLEIKDILDEYDTQINENNQTPTNEIIVIPPIKIENISEKITEYYKVPTDNEGCFNGNGYHIFINNFVYYGNFKNDNYNGKGVLITNKHDNYFGDWEDGNCNGEGILKIKNKFTYKGKFSNNKKNGYGIEIYPNGARYEGNFINNQKWGKGKYFLTNGEYYEGNFENDLYNGNGIYKWEKEGREYKGQFKDGNMEGWGINKFNDGSYYEGYYKAGQKHGKGSYIWTNGKKFTGNWLNNKLHGNGCYEINGEKYIVTFRFGKLINVGKIDNNNELNNHNNNEILIDKVVKFNKKNVINANDVENIDKLFCEKCQCLIFDPQKCNNCGKNYCQNCVKGKEDKNVCVFCGESNFDSNLELLHELISSKIKIYCDVCNKELDYRESMHHHH